VTIHAIVGDEKRAAFLGLGLIALKGIRELGETAAERNPRLDVLGMLDERGLLARGLRALGLLSRCSPNDLRLPRLGGIASSNAGTHRCHKEYGEECSFELHNDSPAGKTADPSLLRSSG
jgi:hypothetical protein